MEQTTIDNNNNNEQCPPPAPLHQRVVIKLALAQEAEKKVYRRIRLSGIPDPFTDLKRRAVAILTSDEEDAVVVSTTTAAGVASVDLSDYKVQLIYEDTDGDSVMIGSGEELDEAMLQYESAGCLKVSANVSSKRRQQRQLAPAGTKRSGSGPDNHNIYKQPPTKAMKQERKKVPKRDYTIKEGDNEQRRPVAKNDHGIYLHFEYTDPPRNYRTEKGVRYANFWVVHCVHCKRHGNGNGNNLPPKDIKRAKESCTVHLLNCEYAKMVMSAEEYAALTAGRNINNYKKNGKSGDGTTTAAMDAVAATTSAAAGAAAAMDVPGDTTTAAPVPIPGDSLLPMDHGVVL